MPGGTHGNKLHPSTRFEKTFATPSLGVFLSGDRETSWEARSPKKAVASESPNSVS
ncbi:hypothetical protein ZHAS_00017455 [Anopheles sinensis]|uniref:Uncharacterized protein n=1 Tax=Anopheles sinensis TaxID=74873 RepID=A0A084WGV6_ANOSI|nr:hypothetical protein ZHAS_00017455 [Anopheles sinensis]